MIKILELTSNQSSDGAVVRVSGFGLSRNSDHVVRRAVERIVRDKTGGDMRRARLVRPTPLDKQEGVALRYRLDDALAVALDIQITV